MRPTMVGHRHQWLTLRVYIARCQADLARHAQDMRAALADLLTLADVLLQLHERTGRA